MDATHPSFDDKPIGANHTATAPSSSREEAAAAFNANPKAFIQAYRVAAAAASHDNNASAVARVLYDCHPLLNVNLLGKQFGRDPERDPLWAQILQAYAECFDFCDKPIVDSLRDFLFRFRLPGEAAQISRVMEAFSHSYYRQNCCDTTTHHNQDLTTSTKPDNSSSRLRELTRRISQGYYLRDVMESNAGPGPCCCCLHCGCIERDDDMPLYKCQGCHDVTFCRRCMIKSSCYGHAFVGRIGFGPACAHILWKKGVLVEDQPMEFDANGKGMIQSELVTKEVLDMARGWRNDDNKNPRPPFANEDAVFVFSYSLIMLTTNLHNPNVKDKMTKQQFVVTNNGINDGENLPGDYLSACYDEIASEKIEVMK